MIIVHGLQDKSRTGGGDASARSEPRLGDGSQFSALSSRSPAVGGSEEAATFLCHNITSLTKNWFCYDAHFKHQQAKRWIWNGFVGV